MTTKTDTPKDKPQLYTNVRPVTVTGGKNKGKTFAPGQCTDPLTHLKASEVQMLVNRNIWKPI